MPRHRARYDLAIENVQPGDTHYANDAAARYLFSVRNPAVDVWLVVVSKSHDAIMFNEFAKDLNGNIMCVAREDCLPVRTFMQLIGREFGGIAKRRRHST